METVSEPPRWAWSWNPCLQLVAAPLTRPAAVATGRLSRGARVSLILGAGIRIGCPRLVRPGPVTRLPFDVLKSWLKFLGRLHDEARRSRRRETILVRPCWLGPEGRLPSRVSMATEARPNGSVAVWLVKYLSESGVVV